MQFQIDILFILAEEQLYKHLRVCACPQFSHYSFAKLIVSDSGSGTPLILQGVLSLSEF